MSPLPSSLAARLRIKDILRGAQPITAANAAQNPAALYLQNLGCELAAAETAHRLFYHPDLDYWAARAGRFPAFLALAVNEETGMKALEATFLTPHGDLADVTHPKLLIGALCGASVTFNGCGLSGRVSTHLLVTERVEAAVLNLPRPMRIAAALRRSNILSLPILAKGAPRCDVTLYRGLRDVSPDSEAKWQAIADELGARGFVVRFEFDEVRGADECVGDEQF